LRSAAGFSHCDQQDVYFSGSTFRRSQDLLGQFSYGPFGGRAWLSVSCALGLLLGQQGEDIQRDQWQNWTIHANPRLSNRCALKGGYDGYLVLTEGQVPYRHHQATMAFQVYNVGPDFMQFQLQGLSEDYPLSRDYDSTSVIGSWFGAQSLGGPYSFYASFAFRRSHAQNAENDFLLRTVNLTLRRGNWESWNVSLGCQGQRQDYPTFSSNEERTRRDLSASVNLEAGFPVAKRLNVFGGDEIQRVFSNRAVYSRNGNRVYGGMIWWF